ncbi:MAG: gamma-glutamylcyclotransferase [Rhodobacteraceae bacterium]|nr:gamma-glutamylcyclotransferase [Paracoccaceae bacterium]
MDCFFYGTLMDDGVLAAVIGRPASQVRRQEAFVEGYRRVYRAGASYPILVPMTDGRIEGILASGLRPTDTDRLIAFEGEDYDLVDVPVRAARRGFTRAMMFMAKPSVAGSSKEWTFAEWRRRYRRAYLLRLRRRDRAVPF